MAMRTSSRYMGFSILAWPYQLRETRQWTADMEIRSRGRRQPIGIEQQFATQQDAEEQCGRVGRELIDGGISGWPSHGESPRRWASIPFREDQIMKATVIAGIILVCLGAFVLLRGASFTTERNVLSVGDAIQVTADERRTVPPWVGGGAMLLGAGLLVAGMRKKV